MKRRGPLGSVLAVSLGAAFALTTLFAQALPNPYRIVEGWAQLPGGRPIGAVGKVTIDPDGRHVWAVIRCEPLADPARFGDECRDSKADVVYKFSPEGQVVTSFGGGMFIWPHGLEVDPEGNVWVTDAVADGRRPKGDKRARLSPFGLRPSATASVTQTLPSGSTSRPCGQMNMPPPKLVTTCPSGLNL